MKSEPKSTKEYYVETYRDPFIADRSLIWFNTFLHMEGLVQLPIFIYAAWALYHNRKGAALWICIYSAHVVTTVLPCLTTLNFGKDSDFGRPGQPVELAPVYVLLASQEASFINGEVYGVTGGKGIA